MNNKGLIKYSIAGFVSLSLFTGANIAAAAETMMIQQTVSPSDMWTADDYRTAKNMPLPQVNILGQQLDRQTTIETDGVMQSSPPKWPNPEVKPDLNNRLFDGTAAHGDDSPVNLVTPNAVGSSGAFYTSGRINNRNSSKVYPWKTNGKLFFKIGASSYMCSASVIGERIVITAGHCVHSGNGSASGYYSSWRFIPAYDSGIAPFSEWTANSVTVSTEWYSGGGGVPNSDDYAILVMNDNIINNTPRTIRSVTGKLGWVTNSLHPNHITSIGYPGNLDSGEIMHTVTAESWKYYAPNNYSMGSDMRGGSSGGAWIQNFGVPSVGQEAVGGKKGRFNRVMGVTSWGWVDTVPKEQGAAQLDGTFLDMWNSACALDTGNC